jgi:membrane protease YdiL (CAAX protease family)
VAEQDHREGIRQVDPSNYDVKAALLSQRSAKQPGVWAAVTFLCIALSFVKAITRLLRLYPPHADWAAANWHFYLALYYLCQGIMVITITAALGWYYRRALFLPRPPMPSRKQLWRVTTVCAPLFCWVVYSCVRRAIKVWNFASGNPDQMSALAVSIWKGLAGGSSVPDVVYFSLSIFFTPVLEEILYTGFVLNHTLRKVRPWSAVPFVALLFTTVHMFFVVSPDSMWIIRMIALSITSQVIRLITGRLEISIAMHVITNVITLIPSWLTIMSN